MCAGLGVPVCATFKTQFRLITSPQPRAPHSAAVDTAAAPSSRLPPAFTYTRNRRLHSTTPSDSLPASKPSKGHMQQQPGNCWQGVHALRAPGCPATTDSHPTHTPPPRRSRHSRRADHAQAAAAAAGRQPAGGRCSGCRRPPARHSSADCAAAAGQRRAVRGAFAWLLGGTVLLLGRMMHLSTLPTRKHARARMHAWVRARTCTGSERLFPT